MSPIDYKSCRLNRNEARKQIAKIVQSSPGQVRFSSHSLRELLNDDLTTVDAWNVLKSPDAKVLMEGEFQNGSFRYRLETNNILVVVAFQEDGKGLSIVTAWRKKGGRK
jgi:hypothetical protein